MIVTCAKCPNPLGRNPFLCDACCAVEYACVGGRKKRCNR